MADCSGNPVVEVRAASKRFPGVQALDRVDLTLRAGEVLAVIGENGAGKSTLMRVLAGIERLDSGHLLLDGQPRELHSVHDALRSGIALIHQELSLCDNLAVGANIFLGREPRRCSWIDQRSIHRQARAVLQQIELDVSPETPIGQLSIGQQQMVEIARALSIQARTLIMDEPTSSLSQQETETLFRLIARLRGQGVGIIYISHRLSEVDRVADRVLVLRDGRVAGELKREEITHDRMVAYMVGRDVPRAQRRVRTGPSRPVLEVRQLVTAAHPARAVSFTLQAGEILGIAGLVGAGRTELLRTLFGIDRWLGGQLLLMGRTCRFRSPQEAIRAGLALVPEDRKTQGLILEMAVRDNLSLASLRRRATSGLLVRRARETQLAERMIARLRIQTPGVGQLVQFLSGGNQQKVVVGKWLAREPRILLLDEPTRGVDVAAKQEIYALMKQLAERQVGLLFASSDLEELLAVADRVLVMQDGRIRGVLSGDEVTEQAVMRLATGREP